MYHDRPMRLRKSLLITAQQAILQRLARDGKHARRLVQHREPPVIINDLQRLILLCGHFKPIILYVKSLEHEIKDGLALAAACWIEMAMVSHLANR